MSRRIAVVGDGAWGKALALLAQKAGHEVSLWSRKNPDPAALADIEAAILAVPAQAVRPVLSQIALSPETAIIISAKGIERGHDLFMHEVAAAVAPRNGTFILSGPSFAADVTEGLPTAVTLAGPGLAAAAQWAEALSIPTFRIYGSGDLIGVAIGGALKNVLAIACGISDGRGLGQSARAALVTRGFAELARFGARRGARPETLMGLSGLGDLMLTCSSEKSRNYAFGKRIGEGRTVAQALAASTGTVEGAYTAAVAVNLARKLKVDMPIAAAVHAIVDEGSSAEQEIGRLLARPVGTEL